MASLYGSLEYRAYPFLNSDPDGAGKDLRQSEKRNILGRKHVGIIHSLQHNTSSKCQIRTHSLSDKILATRMIKLFKKMTDLKNGKNLASL